MQNTQGSNKRGRKNKKTFIETEPITGTRDFYPDDMRMQNWLFGQFKEVARLFGFQEYDCPILEEQELYRRKGSDEILEQMYIFETKEKTKLALRPEMTPSLSRLILKAGRKLLMPIRWFSIPQCWRFENVQRGRKREHYQWNMDIWGVKDVTAEVELLSVIVTFFKRVGITSSDVGIRINSRKILQTVLSNLGVSDEEFPDVCVIVDKLDKIGPEQVKALLVAKGLNNEVVDKITEAISIKEIEKLNSLLPGAPAVDDIQLVWKLAKDYGFEDWINFDGSVVRGLSYYTGIVFECFDRSGKFRAICGGGRYDEILKNYDERQLIPAVGFGFGDCVIIELLQDKGLLPELKPEVDFFIVPFDDELRGVGCQVAMILRNEGYSVDIQLNLKKITQSYEYGDRIGAKFVVFIAPDEWSRREIRIKYLRAAEEDPDKEVNVKIDNLIEYLSNERMLSILNKNLI